ncbi:DUF1329 domain-containing protein [Thauera sinica]|uniref:DUF1329 domain-containing protein n=1 Tax=Thauera sinica TaxID=2665146 RepID=A0ABW1AXY9_9RHOO|nr:DUF1329 domain-containing protein [Thauera sp. K11]ATE58649.1 hypothetical protein CCZ27_00540 [Thauera sp. K11]
MSKNKLIHAVLVSVLVSAPASAAVTPAEAAQLKTTLTPLGAERDGNKDGSIPAWKGGHKTPIPGAGDGKHPDPFAAEQPVVRITAQNAGQHAGRLTEGVLAMLTKYPGYRIDVYPTHRTAGAPQWVYDNTFKAATQARLTTDGLSFEGAWGAVPFPIPKNGSEVMWNHLVHPHPASVELDFRVFVGTPDGKRSMASKGVMNEQASYYLENGSAGKYNQVFQFYRFNTTAPTFKAGEQVVVHESLDMSVEPQAWQYLVGQRRVRRAPTISYDTPDFMASGANYFDEVYGLRSRLDRYDWKLVGKQEMYVPYNNNRFFAAGDESAFVPFHTNPDHVRWELHRVWVVEATLAAGKRHAVPKRRFYIDEDSWAVLLADGYDAEGKLWRTSQVFNMIVPEAEMLATNFTVVYNLQASTMSAIQYVDALKVIPPRKTSYFSGDAMSSDSAR